MEEKIKYLFENTELTIQQIVDEVGSTYKIVWKFIARSYSKEQRNARKKVSYKNSKLGDKNPMKGKTLELHHGYKGGECADGKGYTIIKKPDWYTGRAGSKYVFKHVAIMCEGIGITELPAGFVVHHIDGNKLNNSINNLALVNMSAHGRIHHSKLSRIKFWESATTISQESRVQEDSKRVVPVDNKVAGNDIV